MKDEIIERRVQLRSDSLQLTIPSRIAKELGIVPGQSVRFAIGDGEFTVRPTSPGRPAESYSREIDDMIKNADSDKPVETGKARGKFDKLKI